MSKKLEKTKETKKSTFYENEDYKVKLTQGGYVYKKMICLNRGMMIRKKKANILMRIWKK